MLVDDGLQICIFFSDCLFWIGLFCRLCQAPLAHFCKNDYIEIVS